VSAAVTRPYRRWDGGPTRTCSRCSEPRPLAEFRLDAKGYRRSHCRACALDATRQWRARNREALLARRRATYATRPTAGRSVRKLKGTDR
jgi:hypothetical protein